MIDEDDVRGVAVANNEAGGLGASFAGQAALHGVVKKWPGRDGAFSKPCTRLPMMRLAKQKCCWGDLGSTGPMRGPPFGPVEEI